MRHARHTLGPAVALALFVLGLAAHLPALVAADALDTDRALVLLMARDFAAGNVTPYFWSQNYMAAFEPALLAPLAAADLATPEVAGAVALLLTAVLAALSVRTTVRAGGVGWLTGLVWAVPPAVVVHHHTALYGARLVATLLAFGAVVLASGAHAPGRGGTARREETDGHDGMGPGATRWLVVGVLAGVAYAGDHMMVGWAAAALFLAAVGGGARYALAGAAAPVVLDTVAAALTPAVHLAGPNDPGAWLATPLTFLGVAVPQLLGFLWSRPPAPHWAPYPDIVPGGWAWAVVVVLGGAAVAAVGTSVARVVGPALARRPTGSHLIVALALACAVTCGVFVLVGGDGERWPVRYLVPLWPALSILAGLGVARWPARLRPLAALVVLPAAYTLATDPSWPRPADGAAARTEARAVEAALTEEGVEGAWANYWDTYRLAYLTEAPEAWGTLSVIDRRPDWTRRAREGRPVAYLIRPDDVEAVAALTPTAREASPVAGYRLFLADAPVPVVDAKAPPPPGGLAIAAAIGAGLFFFGVAAAAAGAGSWWSRRASAAS